MKKMARLLLAMAVLLVAVVAGGCASFEVTARGPLPKANEVFVGETVVTHDGKPADAEYATNIANAWRDSVREYMPKYGFRVVDKPGPDTLVLKASIADEYHIWYGLGVGKWDARVDVYQQGALLPVEVLAKNAGTSIFLSSEFNGRRYSGTAFVVRREFAPLVAEKLKEHFL